MAKQCYDIAVVPGDGIGPEVVAAALDVMREAAGRAGLRFTPTHHPAGALHYRDTGHAIAPDTLLAIGQADAILFGAAGWPDIRKADGTEIAPQIDMREHFALFAGLRPARLFAGVPSPLVHARVDMLIVRESTEGLFAGRHDVPGNDPDSVTDRMTITRSGCERLFEVTFAEARRRRMAGGRGHVTLFDKANVLRGMAFMRRIFDEVAERHPDIGTDRVYIDNGAMLMVTQPERFDVVVMENQFGDIVSEIAAGIMGGLGIAPSADISFTHGVFQPCHGTAPDIAARGVANPVATILSAAMLFDWLAERHQDARGTAAGAGIREAVAAVLAEGPRTRDLGGTAGTAEVAAAIIAALPSSRQTGPGRS
ncbi:MAG: isocitrate/isopropylmalate dehydrogenase family protein [Rhodospirillales bacterium]|nr:isocitrate/isopropylmalate dehydrogenase family protein [Rhodospirillales bacterium]MDE2575884.1 isocitrate/isopropylmalate dehydrogenase family protein [Rhodospirillales bacterium]